MKTLEAPSTPLSTTGLAGYSVSGLRSTASVVMSVSVDNGGGGGMDCMPLRSDPLDYLMSKQAEFMVALQKVQNEIGTLFEFRDLAIETCPNLRHKMAATASASASVMSSSCTQSSHIPLPLSSQSSRRIAEWESGKLRRASVPCANSGGGGGVGSGGGDESSSLPRSRSHSHSGGTKNNCSTTVQESDFSSSAWPNAPNEPGDELWNLLDVIHHKGIRLREEVECPQGRLESVATEELLSMDVLEAIRNVTSSPSSEAHKSRFRTRTIEKNLLLDVVGRSDEARVDIDVEASVNERRTRLGALDSILGSPTRVADVKDVDSSKIAAILRENSPLELQRHLITTTVYNQVLQNRLDKVEKCTETLSERLDKAREENDDLRFQLEGTRARIEASVNERRTRLGALDSILASPTRVAHAKDVDSRKIAAILRENSPLELQRHLITTIVHNQVLQKRLDEVEKRTETLSERLDKAREENDDLRFQLEERNIELEDTRARVEPSVNERRTRLGALDSILGSPTRVAHVKDVDSRKIAAILRENSPLELQRHLITTTVHNQVLQKRLDEVEESTLSEQLDKAREENDDLRSMLDVRNIELELTRERVRMLLRLQSTTAEET